MKTAIAFDYDTIERYFRACAKMIAMQRSLQVKWVPYKDSAVLNAIYTVFWWKEGPGTVEADMKSVTELEGEIEKLTNNMVQAWLKKLFEHGPGAADDYVKKMGELRLSAYNDIQSIFREVRQINAEIVGDLDSSIKTFAQIKLGATVGVAVIGATAGVLVAGGATAISVAAGGTTVSMGLGGGGLAFMGVGLGHNLGMSVAKNYEQGNAASAVAIDMGKAGAKTAASEGGGAAAQVIEKGAARSITQHTLAKQNAEVTVRRYSDLLGRKSLTQKNLPKYATRKAAGQQAVKAHGEAAAKATATKSAAQFVGKALPVVFAGWDIYDAVIDYKQDVKGIR
jgi:hypothetical protein